MSLHFEHTRLKTRIDGKRQVALGLRVGYWPCLSAPFVQIVVGDHRLDFWFGLGLDSPYCADGHCGV